MKLPASRLVFDSARIMGAVDSLATRLNGYCTDDDEWTVLCVLNGALMFTGDLIRRLSFPVRLDAVRVTRYHETTAGSHLRWHAKPESDVAGKRILLVDDIFDEGETLAELARYLEGQGATDIVSVVLVEKIHDRKTTDFRPDFVGLECPDAYVFGYGMDFEGRFRNLPEIRELS